MNLAAVGRHSSVPLISEPQKHNLESPAPAKTHDIGKNRTPGMLALGLYLNTIITDVKLE